MTKALLIHPRFNNGSFWNYEASCRLVGARYPAPPLGLITVAALLPQDWSMRLVDRNVEALDDKHLRWADVVLVGGMMPQQEDIFALIAKTKQMGVPLVLGGPAMSSDPYLYAHADFRIIGEAEGAIAAFVEAWERGERSGTFKAPLHTVDVKQTPMPRFDLLDFSNYLMVNVQFSRGCPFLCEFCDIIELFGRKPRTKDKDQILAELDRIYDLGHRGHVDFVDDNLIGNKKAVKAFLPHLIEWQKERHYPFIFSTEASLNLADDTEFMALMRDAGFFAVFIGIESPDPDVLAATQKKQNTKRDIAECVHAVQAHGMFVLAGFIVGFDSEAGDVSDGIIALIEEASIPIAMVGLLYALPNTQLTRRLQAEGRLHDTVEHDVEASDQCTAGLNFDTLRPRVEILEDYLRVVDRLFEKTNFFNRIKRTVDFLDASGPPGNITRGNIRHDATQMFTLLWNATFKSKELRGPMWSLFAYVLRKNPRALKHAFYMAALYEHLGPFSRFVSEKVRDKIAVVNADPNYDANCKHVPVDGKWGMEGEGVGEVSPLPGIHQPAAE